MSKIDISVDTQCSPISMNIWTCW